MSAVPVVRRLRIALAVGALACAVGCAPDGPTQVAVEDVTTGTTSPEPEADGAQSDAPPTDGGSDDEREPTTTVTRPVDADVLVSPSIGALELPDVVGVVGDSLTVSASEEITSSLALLGADTVIDAQEGRRMTAVNGDVRSGLDGIEAVTEIAEPDLWVVALGTNDVGAQTGEERFRDDVRAIVRALPYDAPIVWVDVWIRDRDPASIEANALLREELGRRRAPTAVVDWHARGVVAGNITADGIHLTEQGRRAFAEAIATQLVTLVAP